MSRSEAMLADHRAKYRSGIVLALLTALFYSVQEPFSGEAARQLSPALYVAATQVSLLLGLPLMLVRRKSRTDFVAMLRNRGLYVKLAAMLALGLAAVLLLQYGLSGANPIVITAILNLSPFWAALIAKFLSGKPIPVSPLVFFGCFLAAFAGATLIAFSQNEGDAWRDLVRDLAHATWVFALPLPLLYALSGTLIGEWFADYDESGALAANFFLSICVVVPAAGLFALWSPAGHAPVTVLALALLLAGTLATALFGRLFYQLALSATGNDNGFVSMFLLLVPALAALVNWPVSWLLPDLKLVANLQFFAGLALIVVSLLFFSLKSSKGAG